MRLPIYQWQPPPSPAPGLQPKGYRIVFTNFPAEHSQVGFARDLISNGFRDFDKASLTAKEG